MTTNHDDDFRLRPEEEIDFAFIRGFEHAATLPPARRAAVEAWLHQQQGTTPQHTGGDDCPGCSACTGPTAHVVKVTRTDGELPSAVPPKRSLLERWVARLRSK